MSLRAAQWQRQWYCSLSRAQNGSQTAASPCHVSRVVANRHRRVAAVAALQEAWDTLYTPLVEHLKLQVRMNIKKRSVELRVSFQSPHYAHEMENTATAGAARHATPRHHRAIVAAFTARGVACAKECQT